jgi:hypothetical protein
VSRANDLPKQSPLFPYVDPVTTTPAMRFDGATFDTEKDADRLGAQCQRVLDVMRDGRWRTLRQLSDESDAPEASVSARLRDLRKPRFGGHQVERRRVNDAGTWEYKVRTEV